MKFFDKLKYNTARFMSGRYGVDEFEKFMLIFYIAIWIVSYIFMFSKVVYLILELIGFAVLIFTIFRFLSKDISKRQEENQKFIQYKNKFNNYIHNFFKVKISRAKRRKEHHLYRCPKCRQILSVPKGKGKIKIICPKCGYTFKKRS